MRAASKRIVVESFRGAPHTVQHIKTAALEAQTDYQVRLLAEDVCGHLDSKDYLSEILAVYYWVLGNVRYMNDPRTVELVRSPAEILRRIRAAARKLREGWRPSLDCDDKVALLVALFLIMGREVQIVTVAFKHFYHRGKRQYQHVLIRVREPRTGNWIILDPVAAEDSAQMKSRIVAVKIWPVA